MFRKTYRYGRFFFNVSWACIFSKMENLWLAQFFITLYSRWSILILHWKNIRQSVKCVVGTKAILAHFLFTWETDRDLMVSILTWGLTWREMLHSGDWTLDILRSPLIWIKNMHGTPHSSISLKWLLTFGLEFSPSLFLIKLQSTEMQFSF